MLGCLVRGKGSVGSPGDKEVHRAGIGSKQKFVETLISESVPEKSVHLCMFVPSVTRVTMVNWVTQNRCPVLQFCFKAGGVGGGAGRGCG